MSSISLIRFPGKTGSTAERRPTAMRKRLLAVTALSGALLLTPLAVPLAQAYPAPDSFADPSKQRAAQASLDYMGLAPGQKMAEVEVQNVFIGSCTNSRIEDLRAAAAVLKGRKKADTVKWAIVVPGSGLVKQQAEAEGLDKVFIEAGLEWREPGCSACLGMNPDKVPAGERCASTSNRNFVGRQGPGARTHLVSPAMAAAAAVTGQLTDVRELA